MFCGLSEKTKIFFDARLCSALHNVVKTDNTIYIISTVYICIGGMSRGAVVDTIYIYIINGV